MWILTINKPTKQKESIELQSVNIYSSDLVILIQPPNFTFSHLVWVMMPSQQHRISADPQINWKISHKLENYTFVLWGARWNLFGCKPYFGSLLLKIKMLFNKPSNSTTGFLLQTMLYVSNLTKNDLNVPRTRDEFLLTPMGADSGSRNLILFDNN